MLRKFLLFSFIIVGVSVGVSSVLAYWQVKKSIESGIGSQLGTLVSSLSPFIDGEGHNNILNQQGEIEDHFQFEVIRSRLNKVKNNTDLKSLNNPLYTMRKAKGFAKSGELEFVVVTDKNANGQYISGNRYQAEKHNLEALQGRTSVSEVYSDAHGTWLSASAPIYDKKGQVVGILQADQPMKAVKSVVREGAVSILLAALLSFILGSLVALLFFRAFTQPIKKLSQAFQELSTGNLDCQLDPDDKNGFEDLFRGFNRVTEKLQLFMSTIQKDTESLVKSSGELTDVNRDMTQETENIETQSKGVSVFLEKVNDSAEMVVGAVQEMNDSIKDIANNMREATEVAQEANKKAMDATGSISKLDQSSEKIGEMVELINNIAEQTNLLALNATIEAARAGESGKGFAVVANEVKELAKATADATEEIRAKVSGIQTETKGAVTAIGEITATITKICKIQEVVAFSVEEQLATNSQINGSIEMLSTGTGEVTRNVKEVTSNASHTRERSHKIREASENLSQMASELEKIINKFDQPPAKKKTPLKIVSPPPPPPKDVEAPRPNIPLKLAA